MAKLTDLYKGLKIKTKIILIYISVLIFSLVLSFSVISYINREYTEREVGELGIQTVSALKGNLSIIFENVTQFSDLIYFDEDIQSSLKNIHSMYMDPFIHKNITKSLVNMILSGDYLSGVFIFDKYHNPYSSYKMAPAAIHNDEIWNTEWFSDVRKARGNGFFIHRSEEIIQFRDNRNYISYIREIGDMNTYEPLATLLVTIDARTIESYFNEVSASYDNKFFIVDESGNYVIPPDEYQEEFKNRLSDGEASVSGYESVTIDGQSVVLVRQDMGISGWELVGAFKIDSMRAMAPYYTTAIAIIIAMNILFIFISSMFLTRLIFKPLNKVEKHMELVERGNFIEMPIDEHRNEINNLKNVFNHMTLSIKNLIQQVKDEEQVIAKGKLDIINAQINPHFLYNTLDAVSALALMEDHENCFRMTQALGSFYRNSLNSGMDFISIRDELESIRSYITILNIRYDNKIKVEYDVEEELLDVKILKLILQPPVENAVHHGIKNREGEGHITIRAYRDEDEIIFVVSDDGKGMSEKRIEEVMTGKNITGKSGFGIHSQIQRIRLYYGIENPIMISSEIGTGTEIMIRVKRQKDGES
ncbi:histidine kinase [Proteiniclasticum sp.]|uniref:sensor histidine kinase n=1 Tax=Proteiniclasticum sp. TaxID=2053595 RepID=UPI00289D8F24|nr:histidine kinase [Proteiniclasticum sp.]